MTEPVDVSPRPPAPKVYLGDGVYVRYENNHLVLTAEDGIRVHDIIYLEPDVFGALVTYAQHIGVAR